ncbi:hypothetical protein K469DRAFT_755462 [Zopfia rhizophila CBS 207.26]|uniref:RRM domain-containing protein n=1 Tax=Zopfia rhizophila CBS 207.26 TaxID=1314779 RepID=A0A6A6DFH7_9PEZI|nr:hypothetical protein K469DRAFT_755462 [Zopfia rhizophila CBS 207.26]
MDHQEFPTNVADFANDERISYSTADGKWLLVDENDKEWEFNETVKKWTEPIDDEQVAMMQAVYDAPETADATDSSDKKRKSAAASNDANKKAKKAQDEQPKRAPENRAIYVTNLPLDAKASEVEEVFTRYGGMIDTGTDGTKRIKMYEDEQGKFKGEALVVFFKKESVQQAIQFCDDYPLRPGNTCPNMRVAEADMSYKKNKEAKLVRKDKKKMDRNRAEMNRKLADWSDDEPSAIPTQTSKYDKIVIMKNLFTLEELDEEPEALLEIKDEVRQLAEKYGEVTNVVLYDRETEGIVTVRFKDREAVEPFIHATDGRFFGGMQVSSAVAEERPKFKRSGRGTASDEEEEAERLEQFGKSAN